MDIMTPHDGLTNDKIAKAQMEAVEQKQNEYRLIGQMTKVAGHTMFKFNATTRHAGKAAMEKRLIAAVSPKTGQLATRATYSVVVEKGLLLRTGIEHEELRREIAAARDRRAGRNCGGGRMKSRFESGRGGKTTTAGR